MSPISKRGVEPILSNHIFFRNQPKNKLIFEADVYLSCCYIFYVKMLEVARLLGFKSILKLLSIFVIALLQALVVSATITTEVLGPTPRQKHARRHISTLVDSILFCMSQESDGGVMNL